MKARTGLSRSRRVVGGLTRLIAPGRGRNESVAVQRDDAPERSAAEGLSVEPPSAVESPPDIDDATRRLLIDLTDTASMHCEAEEERYFQRAAKLGVDQLTAARARSRAIELVTAGEADARDLYGVALRLLAE